MAEFKFSCPQCSQHIQCDTSYAGVQINCPACQQTIVVPQASADKPGLSGGLSLSRSANANEKTKSSSDNLQPAQLNPSMASKLWKNRKVVTISLAVLGLVGFSGWLIHYYSRNQSSLFTEKQTQRAQSQTSPLAGALVLDSTKVKNKMNAWMEKEFGGLGKTTSEILSHTDTNEITKVFGALQYRLQQKIDSKGWERLSLTEQKLISLDTLTAEVENGGFDQYFLNSSGNDAALAFSAVKDIGAVYMASIMKRAMDVFPGGKPPADRDQRIDAMVAISKTAKPIWDKLDSEFYNSKEDISKLSLDYARKHSSEIILQ